MEQLIASGLAQLGLADAAAADAPAALARYGQALLEKNKVMNLTAITDPVGVATLHMLDCAALLPCCEFAGKRLIDVGTGAGFPGMVLKILSPTLDVTLLDSLDKRLAWLGETGAALGLTGLHTIHSRAEDAGRDAALREQFDFATARAVADLRVLAELCLPFVKVGGQFLAMKSVECGEELAAAQGAIETLGGRVETCRDYAVPHTDITHRLVVIRKERPTPERFPRRWAKMQKSPL